MRKPKYNKYTQSIDAELDLHGYTVREAEELVIAFLKSSKQKSYSHVRIITGKGNHSKGEGVVRNAIRDYLIRGKYSFRPAKVNEGGDGVFIVNL